MDEINEKKDLTANAAENKDTAAPATEEQNKIINDYIKKMSSAEFSRAYSDIVLLTTKQLEAATRKAMATAGYSPQMGEQILESFFPKLVSTSTEIQTKLEAPDQNEDSLRQISRGIQQTTMAYNRIVSMLSDIKTFKYYLKCDTPGLTKADIASTEYKASKNKVMKFLRLLNLPYRAKEIDKKTVGDGLSFWLYYEVDKQFGFLPVPVEYCYLTSPSPIFGFNWAIDLAFFDRFLYLWNNIPELTQAYLKYCKIRAAFANGIKEYDGEPITQEDVTRCQYYAVSMDEGFCILFDESIGSRLPPTVGVMSAAQDLSAYRALLKQKATADLYTMVMHQIPRDKNTNQPIISFEQAQMVIAAIQAISPYNIKHAASLFEDAEPIKMTTSDVLQTLNGIGNDQVYEAAGVQSSFFSDNEKSEKSLQYSASGLFGFASAAMYKHLTNCFNYLISKKCDDPKYEWSIVFYGNMLEDSQEKADAIKLANVISNPYLLMSAYGIEPFNVENMLLDDLSDIKEKMIPFPTSATNAKNDEGGRPKNEPAVKKAAGGKD